MDASQAFLVILFVACVVGMIVLLVLTSRSSRTPRCPNCNRARVPDRTSCPFCGAGYRSGTVSTTIDRSQSPVPAEAPRLVCVQGPHEGRAFSLSASRFTIGRSTENSLHLDAILVSRYHAQIDLKDDGCVLYDRDSTNGTWVNGRRVIEHTLQPGDQLQIGPFVFAFQTSGQQVSPEPIAQPPERISTPVPLPSDAADLAEYQWPVETIGAGGMSTVYKGISRRNGTAVAIKRFHQSYDQYLRRKFEQEIRIGEQLSNPPHPHITRVLGGGLHDDAGYIIMEFVDNGSLRDRLQPGRPMSVQHVVPVVGQACDALQYAHDQGIYHRDIKPENILFSSNGGIKLCDFGIAKIGTEITHTMDGMLVGTPYYMSYEQADGDGSKVDGRSDIYSLGVVLYEMVTGRPPFVGEPVTVVHKHLYEEPVRPRKLNSKLPAQMEEVIMRALQKDPARRFQRAEQMARAMGYREPFYGQAGARSPAQPVVEPSRSGGRASQPTVGPSRQTSGTALQRRGRLVSSSGQTIWLTSPVTQIGRKDTNPGDKLISRRHARILERGGQFWLEDTGSENGTYLNGRRLFEAALLQAGDIVQVGHTNLRFELPDR